MRRISIRNSIACLLAGAIATACSAPGEIVSSSEVSGNKTTTAPRETELDEKQQQEFKYLFIEALKQKNIGDIDKAVALYSRCLEIDPLSAVSMYELAGIYVKKGDFTSPALLLEKAIKLNSNNDWYKFLLAQIYQNNKEYARSAELLQQLADKNRENLNYLYLTAVMFAQAKAYDEAISRYDQLEEKVGVVDQLSLEKQRLYLEKGEAEKAIKEVEKLIKSNPQEPRYYGVMADLYLSLEEKEKALEYYNKVLEADPENGFVHLSLANFYYKEKANEEAFEEVKRGFVNKQLDIESKIQFLQILYVDKDKYGVSDDDFGTLIALMMSAHPQDPRVYLFHADHLSSQEKFKEAREQMRGFLKANKREYAIYEKLLFLDNQLLDFEALYSESAEAMRYHPSQPLPYLLSAVAGLQLEKYNEVIAILDEGEQYAESNPAMKAQFFMYRAEVYYKQNKFKEAFEAFDQVMLFDPNNYMTMNNYAYYLSLQGEQLDKAERLSGKVIEANPDNATYLDTYAWVLFKRNDYRLAKFYMETALSKGGDKEPALLEHYGDILYMLGRKDEAIEYWKKAFDNGSESEVLKKKIKEETYFED